VRGKTIVDQHLCRNILAGALLVEPTPSVSGLAFLAGFSERLAQDAVARAGGVITGSDGDERRGSDTAVRGR